MRLFTLHNWTIKSYNLILKVLIQSFLAIPAYIYTQLASLSASLFKSNKRETAEPIEPNFLCPLKTLSFKIDGSPHFFPGNFKIFFLMITNLP